MIESEIENKERSHSWIHYIVFFIVVFISDDTFNFGTNENYTFFVAKYIIYSILTLFFLAYFNYRFITVLTKSNLILLLITTSVLLTAFFNFDISGGYLYQIWLFLLGFLIVNTFSKQSIIDVYLKVIYWLSVVSLVIFVAASISLSLFEIFPVYYNSVGVGFYNLGIGVIYTDGAFIRNTGIFREPGVFMIYLSIALILELFFKKKIKKRNFFIFLLALLSTLSTAAFIVLGVILLAYLFDKSHTKSSIKNKLYIAGIGLITLIIVFSTGDIYNLVFDKISGDNVSEGSSLARMISVIANLNIFLDNFIFGVGLKAHPALFGKYTLDLVGISMDTGNNTNTITSILSVYGILFGLIFIYLLFNFAVKTSNSVIIRVLIFFILVMLFSNEDMRYSLMSCIFLLWALKSTETMEVKTI